MKQAVVEKPGPKMLLSFGPLRGGAAGEKVAKEIAKFKPDIYVLSCGPLSEADREPRIKALNSELDNARKSHNERRLHANSESTGNAEDKFRHYELLAIAKTNARIHLVEGHADLGNISAAANRYGSDTLYSAMHTGFLNLLRVRETMMKDYAEHCVAARNRAMAEGFMRLPAELPEVFQAASGNVRVLARLATVHEGVPEMLGGDFNVEKHADFIAMDYTTELLVRLANGGKVSEKDFVADLFSYLASAAMPQWASSCEENFSIHTREVYGRQTVQKMFRSTLDLVETQARDDNETAKAILLKMYTEILQ
jgi:hypothetical protein